MTRKLKLFLLEPVTFKKSLVVLNEKEQFQMQRWGERGRFCFHLILYYVSFFMSSFNYMLYY